jgi:CRISPR-associated endonuclease Csn1
MASSGTETVWAFDLGKGSVGEAVRQGTTFLHKESLLIPSDFAETRTAATRRRMWRTRQAHKARERWLDEVWTKAGLQPLRKRQVWPNPQSGKWELKQSADYRLEREFAPKPGEQTRDGAPSDEAGASVCYTSCLLRIKLLRGERLEPWQIYKGLWSAIQRRGYDPNIPWKHREQRRSEKAEDDEGVTVQRMQEYEKCLVEMAPGQPQYQWPCYFDAWKTGLWDPARPDELKPRQDCQAQSTRRQIVPRKVVEAELRELVEAAAKQIPALKGKADYLLFGPAGKPYASFYAEDRKRYGLREGGVKDWQGVLGQKIPRFDNRIIGKCVLIPRLNVCKVRKDDEGKLHSQSRLAAEVVFLMKLKNMRFQQGGGARGLTAKEIGQIYNDPKRSKLGLTPTQWKKWCVRFGGLPLPGQNEEVAEPRFSGRSRFCRPALEIFKRLILSGDTPPQAHAKELTLLKGNTDPLKGLVQDDLKFLLQMGPTWEGIYIPNQKLEALARSADDPHEAIRQLIGSQNDPVVRHRLTLFAERLNVLAEQLGAPDYVVLEFVREDFMGKQAKRDYLNFQRERAKERAEAREQAAKAGAEEKSAGLKMELLKAQKGECVYRPGDKLIPERLDEYVIDHIVPRAKGGPDAAVNYVLTTRRTNDDKGDQTPYEWLAGKEGWDAYVERVKALVHTLRNKKVQLLTSPDAAALVDKYTALAETAWISKLAQTIVGLRFGWPGGIANGERKVIVVSGGLTGRIRRKYRLNSILNPCPDSEDPFLWEETCEKNRDDDRHHALDAMVISFLPNWARNAKLAGFFQFPEGVHREYFAKQVANIVPQFLCFEKASLAETIYSKEQAPAGEITQRVKLRSLAYKPISPAKTKFDLEYAAKQVRSVCDKHLQLQLQNVLATTPSAEEWDTHCQNFRIISKDGHEGTRVISVKMRVGKADEYADLSKGKLEKWRGAWRKAKKGHKGQFVYIDAGCRPRIRPVYVFESIPGVEKEIRDKGGQVYGFFRSGCLARIETAIRHKTTPVEPGIIRINTIRKDGWVVVTSSSGKPSLPINIERFIEARLKPLHALETLEQAALRKAKAQDPCKG